MQSTDDWFIENVLPLESELTRFLRCNVYDERNVSDLRQEIYAKLYGLAQYKRPQDIKIFLFQTASELIIDRLRLQNAKALGASISLARSKIMGEISSIAPQLLKCREMVSLQAVLGGLSPLCRQVLLMRKSEGLSHEEIASRMLIVVGVVEEQIANGIVALARAGLDSEVSQPAVHDTFLPPRKGDQISHKA